MSNIDIINVVTLSTHFIPQLYPLLLKRVYIHPRGGYAVPMFHEVHYLFPYLFYSIVADAKHITAD